MRQMLATFINALLSADVDAVCGAGYNSRSDERVNSRNGYRHRELDTRAGTIDVAIPKLRAGTYFPDWLPQRRRRAEAALCSVVATCYLLGVSTRRMDKLVQSLGITGLSKSQVSVMVATGVNADGHREVLGVQIATGETHAGWLAFFRDLTARGLSGVELVTSDAHAGLVEAAAATLGGESPRVGRRLSNL